MKQFFLFNSFTPCIRTRIQMEPNVNLDSYPHSNESGFEIDYWGEGSLDCVCYLGAYGWNGVDACVDPEAVPVHQLLPLPPVEADPGRVPAVRAIQGTAGQDTSRPRPCSGYQGYTRGELRQDTWAVMWILDLQWALDPDLHCHKSLGVFRAIARSAAGTKFYSTELPEVKNLCYTWFFHWTSDKYRIFPGLMILIYH